MRNFTYIIVMFFSSISTNKLYKYTNFSKIEILFLTVINLLYKL